MYRTKKYATPGIAQSLLVEPDPLLCHAPENIQDTWRHIPSVECTPSHGRSSVVSCNVLRDAFVRTSGSLSRQGSSDSVEESRARDTVVCALNKSVTGEDHEDYLTLELARVSIRRPRVVTCALLDAALRQNPQSAQRKLLRRVAARLGSCVSLLSCFECSGTVLNFSEEWLYEHLSSPDFEGQSDTLLAFMSELFVPRRDELVPPLRLDVCMSVVAPYFYHVAGLRSIGRCLAVACIQALSAQTREIPVIETGLVVLLLDAMRLERWGVTDCYPSPVDQTCRALDTLWSRLSNDTESGLFSSYVDMSSCMSWSQRLWLWSRGCGEVSAYETWQGAMLSPSRAELTAFDSLQFCEEVLIIAAVSPLRIFSDVNPDERSMVIKDCMDSRIALARLPLSSADKQLVWLASIARQLCVLTSVEHARVARVLPDVLRQAGMGLDEVHRRDAATDGLRLTSQVHIQALALVLTSPGASAACNGEKPFSILGQPPVSIAMATLATKHVCDLIQLNIVKLSNMQSVSADGSLVSTLMFFLNCIVQNGLVTAGVRVKFANCFQLMEKLLEAIVNALRDASGSKSELQPEEVMLCFTGGMKSKLVDAEVVTRIEASLRR